MFTRNLSSLLSFDPVEFIQVNYKPLSLTSTGPKSLIKELKSWAPHWWNPDPFLSSVERTSLKSPHIANPRMVPSQSKNGSSCNSIPKIFFVGHTLGGINIYHRQNFLGRCPFPPYHHKNAINMHPIDLKTIWVTDRNHPT